MKNIIKYGIEPVYSKNKKEKVKVLYGYIVSKCYVLDTNNGYTVLFPYVLTPKTYVLNKRRCRKDAVVDFNTNHVDNVYDTFKEAKRACDDMNYGLVQNNPCWYDKLDELTKLVKTGSKNIKIKKY